MKKWKLTIIQNAFLALLFWCFSSSSIMAQVSICPIILENPDDETVEVAFLVENYQDIVSFQYSLNWNPSIYNYQGIGDFNLTNLTSGNFGDSDASNGVVISSWFHQTLMGVSVPDGTIIYRMYFERIAAIGSPDLEITGTPIAIEVIDSDNNEVPFESCSTYIDNGIEITGTIYVDNNANCILDTDEETFAQSIVLATSTSGNSYYGVSNENGEFTIFVPPNVAEYTLGLNAINDAIWANCGNNTVNIDDPQIMNYEQSLGFIPLVDCASMSVELNTPFLRRCFENTYHVNYCNIGTETAEDAFVDITFDPFLTILNSSIPWTNVNGNTYTFPLGDVAIGACGSFSVQVEVSCDAELGQTHCSTAFIFPRENCDPISADWSGASLEVTGECDDEEVTFIITNNGDAMQESVDFVIIEDEMIMMMEPIQLGAGASEEVNLPANGATWRIEIDQVPFHPGNSAPSFALEGCGTNGMGEFSLGFVDNFPQDDNDPHISIDCQENIGAYDPNDKAASPQGTDNEHFIERNIDLTYKIRFQNTGTDTAFNVVVLDTISEHLDLETLRPGVASHSYELDILPNRVLRWTFADILLPDSTTNEPASNGFFTFKISQNVDLDLGTIIENSAAIYFDFNEPIITNTVSHTIGENFLEMVGTQHIFVPNVSINITPNPATEVAAISISGIDLEQATFNLYNVTGKVTHSQVIDNQQFNLQRNALPNGLYFYQVQENGRVIGSGKLLLK